MLALKYLLYLICGASNVHPISDAHMTLYLVDGMTELVFSYSFSYPNSDYIPVVKCIIEHKEMAEEFIYDFKDIGVKDG